MISLMGNVKARYKSLEFLKLIGKDTPIEIRNSFVDYCIRLVFKHHFGTGSGLKELEMFVSNMSLLYLRTGDCKITDFMAQYLRDNISVANNGVITPDMENTINSLIDDIKTIFANSTC